MASKACINRLQKEYKGLLKSPVPNIVAHPLPNNLLEWHFCIHGGAGTDYEGGIYHGKIVFPPQYPFKPPSLQLFTPNGRFATNTKLCLSITDYHPESWNPMWSVGTILTALCSFMADDTPTTGSIVAPTAERRRLAAASMEHNCKNQAFLRLFQDLIEEHKQRAQAQAHAKSTSAASTLDIAARPGVAGQSAPAAEPPVDDGGGGAGWYVMYVGLALSAVFIAIIVASSTNTMTMYLNGASEGRTK